ncbi:MAG TPA: hemolysin III family protein [Anaeromyxobacteraceae bacterium]|nr:hemolysin III family protein [Anaeromyxobacteraceae bacterium]
MDPSTKRGAPRQRPLLRGVSHLIAAVAAFPAAWWLVGRAGSEAGRVGAAVYGGTLVLLFAVSATYHRVFWTDPAVRKAVGRVDHSAIFLLIAGTYTPFCLLIGHAGGKALLAAVWFAAALGVVVVVLVPQTPKTVRSGLYVLLGWLIVPYLADLWTALGPRPFAYLIGGGALYTVGAAIYASRRPDPFPAVFGFHEIFHVLVIAAAGLQFVAVEAAVRAIPA